MQCFRESSEGEASPSDETVMYCHHPPSNCSELNSVIINIIYTGTVKHFKKILTEKKEEILICTRDKIGQLINII